jgi:hypothetical protein
MDWLRSNGAEFGAQRKAVEMATPAQSLEHSPCCRLFLIQIPRGANEIDHYRCAECGTLYVWNSKEWVPCELPDKHRMLSRETVRR